VSINQIARRRWEKVAAGTLALAIGVSLAGGAMAANTVRTTVTAGTRTASIANLNLGNVAYSHASVAKAGAMKLSADDSSGTNLGWSVTVLASDFAYSGAYSGSAIAASNFGITSAANPVRNAGQAVDSTNGPIVPLISPVGSLDVARKVVAANAGWGKGDYDQNLDVSLNVPADTLVGTYTSTLTVTITAGP